MNTSPSRSARAVAGATTAASVASIASERAEEARIVDEDGSANRGPAGVARAVATPVIVDADH